MKRLFGKYWVSREMLAFARAAYRVREHWMNGPENEASIAKLMALRIEFQSAGDRLTPDDIKLLKNGKW